jgi:hypothetical protein
MSATHVIFVRVPIRIVSEANRRDHWRTSARRHHHQRVEAFTALRVAHGPNDDAGPHMITLVRIAPRALDDDNLAAGFKAARDGVADWLKIDDGDKRLTWRYEQRKGKPGEYAAEIVIETPMVAP